MTPDPREPRPRPWPRGAAMIGCLIAASALPLDPGRAQESCAVRVAVERAWIERNDGGVASPCDLDRELVYAIAFEIEADTAEYTQLIAVEYELELELVTRDRAGERTARRERRRKQLIATLERGAAGLSMTDRGWAACELGVKRTDEARSSETRAAILETAIRQVTCRPLDR